MADRVRAIDALLPQTQCRRCGFDGCLPYAVAVAEGRAPINRCPPGGDEGIAQLAQLLGTDPLPLDPECGPVRAPYVARIDEALQYALASPVLDCFTIGAEDRREFEDLLARLPKASVRG